jgi:hypothetical protein
MCVSAVNSNETIQLWHTRWEMHTSLDDVFPAALLTGSMAVLTHQVKWTVECDGKVLS